MKRVASLRDGSVNWIIPYKNSKIETRYVRRAPHYLSAYLSSHNGCKMGCQFCWLTATGQTNFDYATLDMYRTQLEIILKHGKDIDQNNSPNVRVNLNLMARGEPLANAIILNHYPTFYNTMLETAKKYDYGQLKVNISTILPKGISNLELIDIFRDQNAHLYYSLYSTNQKFRDKWIPNAMPYQLGLEKLKRYQEITNKQVTLHFALIEGENDGMDDIKNLVQQVTKMEFDKIKFNLVRFNKPPSSKYNETSEERINEICELFKSISDKNKTKVVPRADISTRASCGTFFTDQEYEDL